MTWSSHNIPSIYTPVNTSDLLKNQRLVLLVWYLDEITAEQVRIGQVNIKLDLIRDIQNDYSQVADYEVKNMNITNLNKVVGQVEFKLHYQVTTSIDN